MKRDQKIIRTSVIGILVNLFLAAFKAAVGLISNSVAVVLDAVNNLSDAMSSLITIIGTKLAGRKPDKNHPLGHGRIEYLSATLISMIVLYAGLTSLVESVKKIISPQKPDYSPVALLIIAVAVVVKIILGTYVKKTGEEVSSDSLKASGSDALFDAMISATTLAAAVIFVLFGISLEAWLGALISIVIIKSGIEMLRSSLSDILGRRIDSDITKKVKLSVCSFPEVRGAYDLVMHSYGPGRLIGSVHIEVPDVMTADKLDRLERDIVEKVYGDTGVIMTGISIYSYNTGDEEASRIRDTIQEQIRDFPDVLQMHGFYLEENEKRIKMDLVIGFDAADRGKVCQDFRERVKKLFPAYEVEIAEDYDISD